MEFLRTIAETNRDPERQVIECSLLQGLNLGLVGIILKLASSSSTHVFWSLHYSHL